MQQQQVVQQMMEFGQSAWDQAFNTMTLVQDHTEKLVNLSLEQAALLSKEGKKAASEWLKACKEGSETFKKAVDESFQKMAAWWA
jgi:polyhydroxyalkanoate synthesis regulator phasin